MGMPHIADFASRPTQKDILAKAGAPLDRPETATAPAVRPTQADVLALRQNEQRAADMLALDQRGAAALNYLRLCAIQRGDEDYTDLDFQDFREIMTRGDRMATGGGKISRGFGEPVRIKMNTAVQDALARVEAIVMASITKEAAGDGSPVPDAEA